MNSSDAARFLEGMLNDNVGRVNWGVNTFSEEYEWLKRNLRYALPSNINVPEDCYRKCPDILDVVNSYIHLLLQESSMLTGDHALALVPFHQDDLEDIQKMNLIHKQFLSSNKQSRPEEEDASLFRSQLDQFGGEFLGMYVSMHSNFENQRFPWGIYLFPEVINRCADELCAMPDLPRKSQELYRKLLLHSVFRHELFHFQVERFTTILEIAERRPLYLPYKKTVYCHYYKTKYCLEEALAEYTAIESKSIRNQFEGEEFSSGEIRKILKRHADRLPEGYRDYNCESFNGPEMAHRILSAQIAYTTPSFDVSLTDLATVKSQFMTSKSAVPIYVVAPRNRLSEEQRRISIVLTN